MANISKKALTSGDKEAKKQLEVYSKVKDTLLQGKNARTLDLTDEEKELIKDLHLLTAKPVLYVCNVGETEVVTGNEWTKKVEEMARLEGADVLILGAKIEAEIAELESYEDRKVFLAELGLDEPGVSKLIRSAYKLLNLQTFFTAGEKEVRAWTIPVNTKAPQAAGVIHSDFEKGFIRAEVISYEDFIKYGSEAAVKEAGKLRIEGKDYVVQDGDIMHFRFNV